MSSKELQARPVLDTTDAECVAAESQYLRNVGYRALVSLPTGSMVGSEDEVVLFARQWVVIQDNPGGEVAPIIQLIR